MFNVLYFNFFQLYYACIQVLGSKGESNLYKQLKYDFGSVQHSVNSTIVFDWAVHNSINCDFFR